MEINDWLGLMDQRATPPRQSLISKNALSCNCKSLNKSLPENSKRNARPALVTTEQMAVSIQNNSPEEQIICVQLLCFLRCCAAFTTFQGANADCTSSGVNAGWNCPNVKCHHK